VAIYLPDFGCKLIKDSIYTNNTGRLVGVGIECNKKNIYFISSYAPCLQGNKNLTTEKSLFLAETPRSDD
jgi:hypothetical protein